MDIKWQRRLINWIPFRSDFEWADFCDPDHLNVQGAAKLTKMIHRDCGA